MRTITTNWNNSAYNNQTIFVDFASGSTVTVPAGNPVNVRSMYDSVGAGSYFVNPSAINVDEATLSTAPEDESEVVATVDDGVVGALVTAVSDDEEIATVSPASGRVGPDGAFTFTVTSVADGEATITFTCGTRTDTTVVTVATPE